MSGHEELDTHTNPLDNTNSQRPVWARSSTVTATTFTERRDVVVVQCDVSGLGTPHVSDPYGPWLVSRKSSFCQYLSRQASENVTVLPY